MTYAMSKKQLSATKLRIIGHIQGKQKGPTVVFFGGIHGNEPCGVDALEQTFQKLKMSSASIRGTIYGIHGNIPAQLQRKRFLDTDLNRLWTSAGIKAIKTKKETDLSHEEHELIEIHALVLNIIALHTPPFYFVDIHSTSGRTMPFITINDALINRRFSKHFPVPIVLGIEEYLEGPLLSYINSLGYVSLGFEAGQHTEEASVKNSMAFIGLALVFAGCLQRNEAANFDRYYQNLQQAASGNTSFYEVVHRYLIPIGGRFRMALGFENFEEVRKGTVMAMQEERKVRAKKDAIVFMPLYQEQGQEGFFLIRKIPLWALQWSALLRRLKLHRLLTLLPGISWADTQKESLLVNLKIARFFTKSFFHLLGYRNKTLDKDHLLMYNREHTAKNDMYKNTGRFSK